jgi:hypothetical protein
LAWQAHSDIRSGCVNDVPSTPPHPTAVNPEFYEGGCLCGAIRFRATDAPGTPHLKDLAPTGHVYVSRRPRSWRVQSDHEPADPG